MQLNYKRIGDYIQLVDKRNKGLKVNNLIGLSISKEFITSVSNTIGTDMENYKILEQNQFACSIMQVRRDRKMPVALYGKTSEAIISPAYPIFEIAKKKELLPEYLMMWFERSEFDREACFNAVGGVRGSLEWEDFCNFKLPVPSITKQKEIVAEYHTIQKRIAHNQKIIANLEQTAQAIYKYWFVDFEFPDENGKPFKSSGGIMVFNEELQKEIPSGWENSILDKEFNITIGRTPPRIEEKWFKNLEDSIDWISIKDMANCDSYIFKTNETLTKDAVKMFSIPRIPNNTTIMSFKMSIGKLAITTKEMLSNEAIAHFIISSNSILTTEYIYCFLASFKFNALGSTSSIVESINTKMIKEINILIPNKKDIISFQKLISNAFSLKKLAEKQNQKLTELKSLLLSKLATIEN